MADSIRIDTGAKRIMINDGPEFIEFNPSDIGFAERFYQLIQDFGVKQAEYQERAEKIDANKELDANGIPVNYADGLAMMREVCAFIRERIDVLFGKGTSQKVFGESMSLDAFQQFFEGITPFIQQARSDKLAKYAPPPVTSKSKKRAVMK